MDDDDDKVKRLPVRFKTPPGDDEPSLRVVGMSTSESCNHRWFFVNHRIRHVTYVVRDGETEVECSNCGVKLDPMWVLSRLANEESQWRQTQDRYNEEMARLSGRSRTKCEHCGRMTRISNAKSKSA